MNPARAPAKSFRDLVVWQKAHQFVLGVKLSFTSLHLLREEPIGKSSIALMSRIIQLQSFAYWWHVQSIRSFGRSKTSGSEIGSIFCSREPGRSLAVLL